MGRAPRLFVVGVLAVCLTAGVAGADPEARLLLRPEAGLEGLAGDVARAWHRRTGGRVEVGEPLVGGVPEVVTAGEVALARSDKGLRVVVGGEAARFHGADLPLEAPYDSADARAVTLAVETLRDAALAPMPESPAVVSTSVRSPGLVRSPPPPRRTAEPTIYARALLGMSSVDGSLLLGPGAGFGLCAGHHCVVVEGELSLLPVTREHQSGQRVRYRSVAAGVRVQLRPFVWERSSVGITFGPMTRIGQAHLLGTGESVTVTNMGVRLALEGAVRVSRLVELVLEGGADVAVTRAGMWLGGSRLYLEDRWTPWLVGSIRMRP